MVQSYYSGVIPVGAADRARGFRGRDIVSGSTTYDVTTYNGVATDHTVMCPIASDVGFTGYKRVKLDEKYCPLFRDGGVTYGQANSIYFADIMSIVLPSGLPATDSGCAVEFNIRIHFRNE